MLSELQIQNIAIIAEAQLRFDAGFTVLTGETGAGKSIILDALNAVLGERTSRELLRQGADKAQVTALFAAPSAEARRILAEFDVEDTDEVLIRRTISADGRNSCRVNGVPVSVSMLRTLGAQLVNIHGQHDSQALFQPENHVRYLDALAGNEALLARYGEAFRALRRTQRELDALLTDEGEKARQLDMLQFQIDELESADIRPGEREELQNKIALFRNSETVLMALRQAHAALDGDDDTGGGVSLFSTAADCLYEAAEYFPSLRAAAESLESAALEAREWTSEIRDCAESLDMDPREMQRAEERLDLLYRLGRKYGESEEEMLQFLADAVEKAEQIEGADERARQLEQQIAQRTREVQLAADALTESRRKAGETFARDVCRELEFLDMPSVRFVVLHETGELTPNGRDKIEFLISANAGEQPRPIVKIASGGELSRIMLAIKNVLNEHDGVDTLVVDEIDAGISGSAAQKVARKLSQLSRSHQVICVTHLTQIAAMADAHLRISKSVRDGQTYTAVEPLDFEGRKQEIARIGAGSDITSLQLQNAEEMLLHAQKIKEEF